MLLGRTSESIVSHREQKTIRVQTQLRHSTIFFFMMPPAGRHLPETTLRRQSPPWLWRTWPWSCFSQCDNLCSAIIPNQENSHPWKEHSSLSRLLPWPPKILNWNRAFQGCLPTAQGQEECLLWWLGDGSWQTMREFHSMLHFTKCHSRGREKNKEQVSCKMLKTWMWALEIFISSLYSKMELS